MIKGLVGVLTGILVMTSTPSTMQVNDYIATKGIVIGCWEEPEGMCADIDTEYGRGILADGYHEIGTECIVVFDTKGTQDYYYDDEIVQIIKTK